ncbi:MAG: hypothetical protein O6761_06885 [Thaumarchaeota archaeon]|nr:hypothetical protein [Nitrososphaerota archaeon]
MAIEAWNNTAYDGRKLRGIVRRCYNHLDRLSKKKNPDWDDIFNKVEVMSRISHRHAKLIDTHNLEERTENIEKLLQHIPQPILAEAKAKAGI